MPRNDRGADRAQVRARKARRRRVTIEKNDAFLCTTTTNMPIIDGGLEVRLYPAVVPRHLNAIASAHQYFCREDRRKRGRDDEIVSLLCELGRGRSNSRALIVLQHVYIDPTYVKMVSCGIEVSWKALFKSNEPCAQLRTTVVIFSCKESPFGIRACRNTNQGQ